MAGGLDLLAGQGNIQGNGVQASFPHLKRPPPAPQGTSGSYLREFQALTPEV
jgi:hypothetical protein